MGCDGGLCDGGRGQAADRDVPEWDGDLKKRHSVVLRLGAKFFLTNFLDG